MSLPKNRRRNKKALDAWSFVHLCNGILLGWLMNPYVALTVMVLWEPLEIFILSPLLAKIGVNFGYEHVNNSLPDVLVDGFGVVLGSWLLTSLVAPPFYLF